jgi:hypothetical protein
LEDDHSLYTTHQLRLAANARTPSDNEFDRVRTQFEAAIAPNFHEHIRFAALTLDRRWLKSFGLYAIVLKEPMIAHRATVFEENPFEFAKRLGVLLSQPMPPGYRATWDRRADLAKAKLYPKLNTTTDPSTFGAILLNDSGSASAGGSDYIEVHIYGSFNRNSIERVIGPKPRTKEDRLLWRRLGKSAAAAGVILRK